MNWVYGSYVLLALCTVLMLIGRTPTAYAAFVLVTAVSLVSVSLGRPKPMWLELECPTDVQDADILGALPDEANGRIFLWLHSADCQPTAYSMPWSRKMAEQLQQAMEEAERNGTAARMHKPFERTYDQMEPKFYAEPQQPLPPKPPAEAPLIVPEQSA